MTDTSFTLALDTARAVLDTHERVWLLGFARLVDVPPQREFSEEEVAAIIDLAGSVTHFPSGPVGYVPEGYRQDIEDEYRMIRLRGDSAPHLDLRLGLGVAGFVAVALTRSGAFDNGVNDPSGILLSDLESVICDTFTLGVSAAVHLGYLGVMRLRFEVVGPDDSLSLYALDDQTGLIVQTRTNPTGLSPVEHAVVPADLRTPHQAHRDIFAIAEQFSAQFGVESPQLVAMLPEDSVEYDGIVLPVQSHSHP